MQWLFLGMILLAVILMLFLWIGNQKPETLRKLGFNLVITAVIALTVFLLVTGKWQFLWVSFLAILPWINRVMFFMPLLRRVWRWFATPPKRKSPQRMFKTSAVQVEIDRQDRIVNGLLLSGTFRGWKFAELRGDDIKHVFEFLDQTDPMGTEYFAQFLHRIYGPQWQRIHRIHRKSHPFATSQESGGEGPLLLEDLTAEELERKATAKQKSKGFHSKSNKSKIRRTMTREEALKILGLSGRPDREAINAAFYERMKENHPDRGGSNEMAARLNQARDLLLEFV